MYLQDMTLLINNFETAYMNCPAAALLAASELQVMFLTGTTGPGFTKYIRGSTPLLADNQTPRLFGAR